MWDADMIRRALDACDDSSLYISMNLAFACSLRMGEILGLTWSNVHISDAEIDMITRVYAHILDEDRKVNAQKFESAFYANPDLREMRAPQEQQPTIDLASLLIQLQQNPELASALAGLLGQKANTVS